MSEPRIWTLTGGLLEHYTPPPESARFVDRSHRLVRVVEAEPVAKLLERLIAQTHQSHFLYECPGCALKAEAESFLTAIAVERDDSKRPAARPLGSIPHAGGPPLAQVGSADQAGAAGGHGVVPLSGEGTEETIEGV